MAEETYLVLMATGRQGRAVINALIDKGVKSIVATSRNPESGSAKKLLDLDGVTQVLKADLNDSDSVLEAIKTSGASRIWFTTDWYSIKKPTRAKEAQTGYNAVDAIKKTDGQIKHVVYTSVCDADNCPKTIEHFWAKADIEAYLKKELPSSMTWSFLRPVAFFENLDDPKNYNPLKKGKVSFLTYKNVKVKFIATEDIGKGVSVLLMNPEEYAGKTVNAAGGEHDGPELAQALTEVSGTKCKFSTALPRFVLRLFMSDLYYMVTWFESDGYSADIEEFKKLVPDAKDAKGWFAAKGQWSNGEKFAK